MGPDSDIAGILRDLVKFLESLNNVELPETLSPIRESLLTRSKTTLLGLTTCSSASPEPYLDMNAGKGMLLVSDDEEVVQEYVDADAEQIPTNQDDYESFQEVQGTKVPPSCLSNNSKDDESDKNDVSHGIYASLSAIQAKVKCQKCGLLYKKEGRKLFVFELFRTCFVSLIDSHLLIYGNERENRPHSVITLRGYKSRAAPSIVLRDQRRSDSAFEIFRPGSKTFQFVAKSPEDMQDWVDVVCRMGETEDKKNSSPRQLTFLAILEELERRNCSLGGQTKEERYQDIIRNPNSKASVACSSFLPSTTASKQEEKENLPEEKQESVAPPLPVRAPRRLPSLPEENNISSYNHSEEHYEEDDIYHRIEDLKEIKDKEYMNCDVFVTKENENEVLEMYDDVQAAVEKIEEAELAEPTETYDDVQSIRREERIKSLAVTPDIVNFAANSSPKTEQQKEESKSIKEPKSSKSPLKRSFLDRMRNRKDSPKKESKKEKQNTLTPSTNDEDLPSYDDISNITNIQVKEVENFIEEEEYLSPPPPRPVCSSPPSLICTMEDELYDDIGARQNKPKLETTKEFEPCISVPVESMIETEHYQIPKANNRHIVIKEELYDDVAAIAADRQKENKNPEKKIWNRIGSVKKNRLSDCEPMKLSTDEMENSDESLERHGKMKMLQMFMNKVENSLGKSGKTVSPIQVKSNGVTR